MRLTRALIWGSLIDRIHQCVIISEKPSREQYSFVQLAKLASPLFWIFKSRKLWGNTETDHEHFIKWAWVIAASINDLLLTDAITCIICDHIVWNICLVVLYQQSLVTRDLQEKYYGHSKIIGNIKNCNLNIHFRSVYEVCLIIRYDN